MPALHKPMNTAASSSIERLHLTRPHPNMGTGRLKPAAFRKKCLVCEPLKKRTIGKRNAALKVFTSRESAFKRRTHLFRSLKRVRPPSHFGTAIAAPG